VTSAADAVRSTDGFQKLSTNTTSCLFLRPKNPPSVASRKFFILVCDNAAFLKCCLCIWQC